MHLASRAFILSSTCHTHSDSWRLVCHVFLLHQFRGRAHEPTDPVVGYILLFPSASFHSGILFHVQPTSVAGRSTTTWWWRGLVSEMAQTPPPLNALLATTLGCPTLVLNDAEAAARTRLDWKVQSCHTMDLLCTLQGESERMGEHISEHFLASPCPYPLSLTKTLVNVADNKQRDLAMNAIKVNVDPELNIIQVSCCLFCSLAWCWPGCDLTDSWARVPARFFSQPMMMQVQNDGKGVPWGDARQRRRCIFRSLSGGNS